MTARHTKALIEVNIAFHPEALREMLFLRDGTAGKLLRMLSLCFFAYLAIGLHIVLPQFFPELHCNPAPLLVAYCALRSRRALLPAVTAVVTGLLLEAECGCRLGAIALPMVAIAAVLHLTVHCQRGRRRFGAWTEAAVAGAFADGVYALWTTLFLAAGMPWRQRFVLCASDALPSVILTAVAYAPLAFAAADCLLQPAPAPVPSKV